MIPVLDHGYVKLCEAWGHGGDDSLDLEAGIICAARQSTQGSFRGWERDEKLLRFLYEHRHSTPFEFAGMTIEVQAPIFVLREWHRHRTQSYSEVSARYSPLPDLYYTPDAASIVWRAEEAKTTGNKQAGAVDLSVELTAEDAQSWLQLLEASYTTAEAVYQLGLKLGIPKEIARCPMPVGHYTRMRATANLRNWLAFLTLRMDPAAQYEIRQFANALGEQIIAKVFPRTWALFEEGRQ